MKLTSLTKHHKTNKISTGREKQLNKANKLSETLCKIKQSYSTFHVTQCSYSSLVTFRFRISIEFYFLLMMYHVFFVFV